MKNYTLALLTAAVLSTSLNAMEGTTEIETAILQKINNPLVMVGGAGTSTYKMLSEDDINSAFTISGNSEPVRFALVALLTETLNGIAPGCYHVISHVRATLELKDERLCKLALDVTREGARRGEYTASGDYTDYQDLRQELIARNPALGDYFSNYAETFGPFLAR